MSDLKTLIERETERFELQPGALDRVFDRRRRRIRRQRLAATALAVAISVGIAGAIVSLGALRTSRPVPSVEIPGNPIPTPGLIGAWATGRLSQSQIVEAFIRAGGSQREGRAFFAELGHGTKDWAIVTLRFDGRSLVEFESADGGPSVIGYRARTHEADKVLTLRSPGCTGTYRIRFLESHPGQFALRLHVLHQCAHHDGPYNTTLFASFWFAKTS